MSWLFIKLRLGIKWEEKQKEVGGEWKVDEKDENIYKQIENLIKETMCENC
jgi:hypothetical protein